MAAEGGVKRIRRLSEVKSGEERWGSGVDGWRRERAWKARAKRKASA